jgi:hypothetical protein
VRILLLALLLSGLAASAQAADCPYNANAAGLAQGQSLACHCAPVAAGSRIYGTDRYTADSGLCTAALHAGALGQGGGEVTVTAGPACKQFLASERNGIASSAFGAYGPTIGFSDPLPPCAEEAAAAETGDRLTDDCRANGGSAAYCPCEAEVLVRELGADVIALIYRIDDAFAAGGPAAEVTKQVEAQLTEVGAGLSVLPELKAAEQKAHAVLAKACVR